VNSVPLVAALLVTIGRAIEILNSRGAKHRSRGSSVGVIRPEGAESLNQAGITEAEGVHGKGQRLAEWYRSSYQALRR